MERILLAEDEESLRSNLKLNLELEGYKVVATENGAEALKEFRSAHFNLVILDIMMPEIDGINVCESIRLTHPHVPVMFLSAKSTGSDRVLGLKSGADDYLVKPFNLEELLLRVGKLLHRNQPTNPGTGLKEFTFGKNYVNFESFDAVGVSGPFKLTKKEAQLLKLLIEHRGEVVSREKILQTVWGYSVFPNTRTIDNFILSFRKYFENPETGEKYISSTRGVGYRFDLP